MQVCKFLCTTVYTLLNADSSRTFLACVFSARQHICYSALYVIARPSVRLSVCPSVRHTGGSVKDG